MEQFITEAESEFEKLRFATIKISHVSYNSRLDDLRKEVKGFLNSKLSQAYILGKEEGKREMVSKLDSIEKLDHYIHDWCGDDGKTHAISMSKSDYDTFHTLLTNPKTEI